MTRGVPLAGVRLLLAALPIACLTGSPAFAQTRDSAEAPAATAHDHDATPAPASSRTPAPSGAYLYIGWPQDGEVIRSTRFKVWFGARDIGVAPAGVALPGVGHHHLLIDAPLPDDMTVVIPNDRNHLHFGLGQTETVLDLAPGTHTLQLLMGDAAHVPHDPPVYSRRITIHVRPGPPSRTASAPGARPAGKEAA